MISAKTFGPLNTWPPVKIHNMPPPDTKIAQILIRQLNALLVRVMIVDHAWSGLSVLEDIMRSVFLVITVLMQALVM